jgi:outer membrane protein
MKVVCIVSCFLLVLSGGIIAKEYTLDECIKMAVETNPDLTASRNAVRSAKAVVLSQKGQFLPSASASLRGSSTHNGPSSPSYITRNDSTFYIRGNPASNSKSYSMGLDLSYTLFDGLQNVWGYLGSRASQYQAEQEYISQRSNQVYSIKNDYYQALENKKDLEVAQGAVKRSEELLKVFQEKYEVGSASKSDVLKQQVQYGNDQLTLVTKDNQFKTSLNQLALDIGIDPKSNFSVADIPVDKDQPVAAEAELIAKASQNHPTLQALKASLDAYRYDVKSQWGAYMPRLSMNYSYGWNKELFGDVIKGGPYDHSGTLSMTLSYNIFDGFSREKNLKQAQIGLANTQASYAYTRNQIIKGVQDAYLAIKLAEETRKVTDETEKAASEDMDLVQAKYNLGSAALWELLDAQVSLSTAQFNKIAAEFSYYRALAGLQRAMGE